MRVQRVFSLVFVLLFVAFLLVRPPSSKAATIQNLVLSCLDGTKDNDGFEIGGTVATHITNLKNKERGVFAPNKEIYVLRSLPRVSCNPKENPVGCVANDEDLYSFCDPAIWGDDVCNIDIVTPNKPTIVCAPNNIGPGITTCRMKSHFREGQYWECLQDKNGVNTCPAGVYNNPDQTIPGGHPINVPENGHVETGYESGFMSLTATKEELKTDENGNFEIVGIRDYTGTTMEHAFYGLQILEGNTGVTDGEAFENALKLLSFTPTEEGIEPSATNCTTVFWDPYGAIIDSFFLEPIRDVSITLKNLTNNGSIVQTIMPGNPFFKNPQITTADGAFNFAVIPGTYFLSPTLAGFSFPSSQTAIDTAINRLSVLDPNQDYIKRDKIYNNPLEPIVERAGAPERRDIILEPQDPNYQGSTPEILYAENLRDGSRQLLRGRVSHPRAVVKANINNVTVAQAEADVSGSFTIIVPGSIIPKDALSIVLIAEKTPLVSQNKPSLVKLMSHFLKLANAQSKNTSAPYILSTVPTRLSGFAFDDKLQTTPNAVVQIVIPSMGNMVYATTTADKDGFISINKENLPPFEFRVNIKDQKNQTLVSSQNLDTFVQRNVVYTKQTGMNYFSDTPSTNPKPSPDVVKQIKEQTPTEVQKQASTTTRGEINNLNAQNNKPTIASDVAKTTQNSSPLVFIVVFLFFISLVVAALFFLSRSKQKPLI